MSVQAKNYSQLAARRLGVWAQLARTTFRNASAQQRALYLSVLAVPPVLLIVLAVKVAVAPVQPAVEQADKKFSRTRTLEETTAINTGAPALVRIAVTPWGEVYLDGRMQGVSPPLAELRVTPGKHEIEIRNTTFPAYRQRFQVEAGGQIKIKHKFNN